VQQDESTEIFEVDLRIGLLIDKHTDFYLPGSIPIEFRRATRDGWKGPMAFGLSGNHNYDKFLQSADVRRIKAVEEDGGGYELDRTPSWLPLLPYPSGEVLRYEYNSMQHLLTFSAARDDKAHPRVLLRNQYERGRLTKQTFADGKTYNYRYFPIGEGPTHTVFVHTPGTTTFNIYLGEGNSTVLERDTQLEPHE